MSETTEKLKRTPGACYLFNNQNRRARGGGFPSSSYKLPELSESRRELNSRYKSTDPSCAPGTDFTELARRRPNRRPSCRLFVYSKNCRVPFFMLSRHVRGERGRGCRNYFLIVIFREKWVERKFLNTTLSCIFLTY